jgi:hypothetical protein
MVERRNLMGGGLAAGFAALVAGGEAEAAAQSDGGGAAVASAVGSVRDAINNLYNGSWGRINQVREQQRIWLRANHKYPDFIELGVNVWDGLYDWHVRYQQPINMTRTADGRYLMAFMFTTFILRPDQDPNYVGPPFDGDRRPVQ